MMQETRITPGRRFGLADLQEVWTFRDLFWILALRDLKIRYKQTVVGAAWAILQPLATTGVFTLLFGLLGRSPTSSELPYPVTAFCALLPWQVFASSITLSARSLVTHQQLVRKVYFPRMFIPLAPLLSGLVDFLIALPVLVALMLYYDIAASTTLLWLPALTLLLVGLAVAAGLWLSAMNALYRDIQQALPFVVQIWFFLSPVVYESQGFIPERWQLVLALNPLTGILEGFRWAILGTPLSTVALTLSILTTAALFVSGILYFRRMERTFVDWV